MIDDEWLDPHYLHLLMSIFCSFINWVSFLRILFIVIVRTGCSMACQKGKTQSWSFMINHGSPQFIMDLHRWFMNFRNWIMGLHNWIYGDRIMEFHIIRFMKIHNAQFHSRSFTICCYMELQTICGDPSSTWWSSIIYILRSSMIECRRSFIISWVAP